MKRLLILLTLIICHQVLFAQREVSGIIPAKKITIGNEDLNFNGVGLREKFFLDLYVGALYLKKPSSKAADIIKADESMAITLDIVSGFISSEKMIDAIKEGFDKSTNGNPAPLKEKIKSFQDSFKEEIIKGDHYVIAYLKDSGIEIYKNGKKLKTIEGLEFKKALFGIWLGDEPADEDLREGMLGK